MWKGLFYAVLASWFRLKYPHLAVGALASSAPILYFDNITPPNSYYSVVTRDYRVIYHNLICFVLYLFTFHEMLEGC